MKTTSFKALLILGGLMLTGTKMQAGIIDSFKNFVGNEFTNFHLQGLYVIGGIVITSMVFYLLNSHFTKEDRPVVRQKVNPMHGRRQHQRSVIKKTA